METEYKEYKLMNMLMKIIITITLGIMIFSFFIYAREKASREINFFDMGNTITNQSAVALESWIEDQVRVVKTIANDERIIEACINPEDELVVDKATGYLLEMNERYPYYENLPISIKSEKDIVKDINGKKVTIKNGAFLTDTVGGVTVGKGGMDYSYVKEIFDGKDYYISEIYPSILRGNPIFVISCPIKYNNEMIGVAIISPQMDYFTEKFIDDVSFEKTGYMVFLDKRGRTIAHRNREFILKETEEVNEKFSAILSRILNGEKNFEEEFLGDKKLYSSTKVDISEKNLKYEWYIVFTQENEEIFASTKNLLNMIIVMIFISTILITIIINIIIKIYSKQIYEKNLLEMNKSLEENVNQRTKELQELAESDSLTKLFNHNTSFELLEGEINKAKKTGKHLSIMMLDLDFFKKVNDNYGHQAGDEVLKNVADVIKSNIRQMDIAGRYGGEEFLIILPNSDINAAVLVSEKIKGLISQTIFDYEGLNITCSIGVCSWNGESAVELVSNADKLLYKAKENGRNRVEREYN